MKNKVFAFLLISFFIACSSTEICKQYETFYFDKYGISSNCSGSPEGNSRNKIYREYLKKIKSVDSSLIVIEQLSYSLATDFISNETIFIKDYKFDKQYRYVYKKYNKDKKSELKDISADYGKALGKPNYTTVNIILDKIKIDGIESILDLVRENSGGVEGNTNITVYDKNLNIVNGIRLKRQLRFQEELPPIPKTPR